jgi:hypothetical protein
MDINEILNIKNERKEASIIRNERKSAMENFIEAIENLDVSFKATVGCNEFENVYQLRSTIDGKRYGNLTIYGTLFCCYRHIQFLKELGIQMDLSNKRVGMQDTQKRIGSGQNECAINVKMTSEVFLKINSFFRNNSNMDLTNDYDLSRLGFKKKKKYEHIWQPDEIINDKYFLLTQKIAKLRREARSIKQMHRRKQRGYGFGNVFYI